MKWISRKLKAGLLVGAIISVVRLFVDVPKDVEDAIGTIAEGVVPLLGATAAGWTVTEGEEERLRMS